MDLVKCLRAYRHEFEVAKKKGDAKYALACEEMVRKIEAALGDRKKTEYPQAKEENEYRYIDASWLDQLAAGLTAGVDKHPGESWHIIPAEEHSARAMRHLNLYRAGDESDNHLLNAAMRCMMAYVVDRENKTL